MFIEFFIRYWIAIAVLYVTAQIAVPAIMRWPSMLLAFVPLPVTVSVFFDAYQSYQHRVAEWPFGIMIFAPLGLAYLAVVALVL